MDVTSLDEFYAGGPTSILNPSPCYGTHWDPSKMSSYILPSVTTNIPLMDPRPCVRVCQKYVFSKWNIVDNIPTPEIILPGGAAVQLPKLFNPVLGKYETVICQLVDRFGNIINNTDCDYDFVLECTEISQGPKDTTSLVLPNTINQDDLIVYQSGGVPLSK
jgi:hypothetical protein